jgi:hypothetical protein
VKLGQYLGYGAGTPQNNLTFSVVSAFLLMSLRHPVRPAPGPRSPSLRCHHVPSAHDGLPGMFRRYSQREGCAAIGFRRSYSSRFYQ